MFVNLSHHSTSLIRAAFIFGATSCTIPHAFAQIDSNAAAECDGQRGGDMKIYNSCVAQHIGEAKLAGRDYDGAIDQFDKAINLNPFNVLALIDRADAYDNLRKYDEAINDLSTAIKIEPIDVTAYNNRGNVYSEMEKYDLAINDYSQAIKLNPKDPVIFQNRGDVYRHTKDYDNAIKDYGAAIALDPKNPEIYRSHALAFRFLDNLDNAVKDYDKAIELDPNDAGTYENRGFVYLGIADRFRERGEQDNALEKTLLAHDDFVKALQLNPSLSLAREALETIDHDLAPKYPKPLDKFILPLDKKSAPI